MSYEPATPPAGPPPTTTRSPPGSPLRPATGCSRSASEGLEGRELKDAGDLAAHELLIQLLAEHRPGDAVLSEEGKDDKARLTASTGSGSSTRSTAPASSPSRRATTGPCTSPSGAGRASWWPAPSPSPRWVRRSTPARHPSYRPRARDAAAHRGLPHPPAGFRAGAGRGDRRRAGADGLGGGQGDLGDPRRQRCLRARRWAVRVGLRRPGRRGARRRAVHRRVDGSPLVYNQDDVCCPTSSSAAPSSPSRSWTFVRRHGTA